MTHTVLFVCSMNVCRSPLMQWAFSEGLSASGGADLEVMSRGMDARRGNKVCSEDAKLMQKVESGRKFARQHTSAPVTTADLATPDLVIAATRAERAMLARYAPPLRPVTFTMREANLLASEPATSAELLEISRAEERHGAPFPLQGFPVWLHRRRGTILIPESRGWGQRRSDPLDVPDTHLSRPSLHRATLRTVHEETSDLASRFAAFCARRSRI